MKLSVADHVLIAAIALIASPRRYPPDAGDVALTLSILRDVLPGASRDIPGVAALAHAAAEVLADPPERIGSQAVWKAEGAMDRWHRERMAAAWDAFQRTAARAGAPFPSPPSAS